MQTRADLEALIAGAVPESISLDYKRSESLSKENQKRNELIKDVSAFANSAGGRLIYGIPEQNQVPHPLDGGVDKTQITPEWIEQVLNSNVQPRIENLRIIQIDAELGNNQVFYVIDVPQATSRAPHQAADKKYYRRFNFQSVAMEDYEIRDTFRRSTTPALRMEFKFADGSIRHGFPQPNNFRYASGIPLTDTLLMVAAISNDATQPAEHVIVDIYIQPQIEITAFSPADNSVVTLETPVRRLMRQLRYRLSAPHHMPIFKEVSQELPGRIGIRFTLATAFGQTPVDFPFGYRVRCPGFDVERWGFLRVADQSVSIDIAQ